MNEPALHTHGYTDLLRRCPYNVIFYKYHFYSIVMWSSTMGYVHLWRGRLYALTSPAGIFSEVGN